MDGEKDRNYDFLNSIEVLIMDQSEIFLMQNWDHILSIFQVGARHGQQINRHGRQVGIHNWDHILSIFQVGARHGHQINRYG